jgi:competence protein ComEC
VAYTPDERQGDSATTATGTGVLIAARLPGLLATQLELERHRWFLWVPVLVGAGIGLYFTLPVEPGLAAALAALAAALVLAGLVRRSTLWAVAASVVLVLAVGFALAKARTEWVAAPVLQRTISNADIRGFIELVEPTAGKGQRLTIKVHSIASLAEEATPRRVRIRAMNAKAGLAPGDAIQIVARLSPPAEPVLPGGYDFGRRAWYLGIGGVGFALKPPQADPDAGPPSVGLRFSAAIERVRLAIGAAITAALPGQTGAIATALVTGERGGISPETDKAFRDSGLYHILSISGLHMTVMAGTLFFAVRAVLAAVPGLALRLAIKKWAALAAAVGALGYLLISGGAFATLRSYVMISIIFLAIIAERPALAMRNVALAALAVLVVWPESLLDPGFQMSFAAVTALISAFEAIRDREQRLGRPGGERGPLRTAATFVMGIVLSTLIAGIAVAPLAAYHFHTSQQYSVLGNVLALPVCDLLVMPALLAALVAMPFGLEAYPLALAGAGIDAMTWVANWVGRLPGAVAAIPAIPLSAVLLMTAGGLWLMLWSCRWRLLGLVGVAAGLMLAPMLERPILLVGRDGALVAARVDGGRLSAPSGQQRLFELGRWLEADGDNRSPTDAAAGRGFRCDGVGCTAILSGHRLAVVRHRAAVGEDCTRASMMVLAGVRPLACAKPALVIDEASLRTGGVHAVYLTSGGLRVETVARSRGSRPWTRAGQADARRPGPLVGRGFLDDLRPRLDGPAQTEDEAELEANMAPSGVAER